MKGHGEAFAYRSLMAAVIDRAINDLRGIGPHERKIEIEKDRAMEFILSEDCEAWCLELGIGYNAIREKAVALYQRIIKKEPPGATREKRLGRQPNGLRHIRMRQSPGKLNIGSGTGVVGHFGKGL